MLTLTMFNNGTTQVTKIYLKQNHTININQKYFKQNPTNK